MTDQTMTDQTIISPAPRAKKLHRLTGHYFRAGFARGQRFGRGADFEAPAIDILQDGPGQLLDELEEAFFSACNNAEENDRSCTPFEYRSKEINDLGDYSEECWTAFDAGISAGIASVWRETALGYMLSETTTQGLAASFFQPTGRPTGRVESDIRIFLATIQAMWGGEGRRLAAWGLYHALPGAAIRHRPRILRALGLPAYLTLPVDNCINAERERAHHGE